MTSHPIGCLSVSIADRLSYCEHERLRVPVLALHFVSGAHSKTPRRFLIIEVQVPLRFRTDIYVGTPAA